MNRTLGVILIVLGLFGLAWGGFTYTTREKVLDVGPIHATRDKEHNVPLPPTAGGAAVIGGILLVVAGKKDVVGRRSRALPLSSAARLWPASAPDAIGKSCWNCAFGKIRLRPDPGQ